MSIVDRILRAAEMTGGKRGQDMNVSPKAYFDDLYRIQSGGQLNSVDDLLRQRAAQPDWSAVKVAGNSDFHELRRQLGDFTIEGDGEDLSPYTDSYREVGITVKPASAQDKTTLLFSDGKIPKKKDKDIVVRMMPMQDDGIHGGTYDMENKLLTLVTNYGNPDKPQSMQTMPVMTHEMMHGMQDAFSPSGRTVYSDANYAQLPNEVEARLSAYRSMYGKPIITDDDAEQFMDWFSSDAGAAVIPKDKDTGSRMLQNDRKIMTLPKNRSLMKNIMRLIVQNKDDRPKENYA